MTRRIRTALIVIALNNLIGTYFHQAFGKIVARFGERRVLTVNFVLLTLVFLGYAFIPMLGVLERPTFQVPRVDVGGWVMFGFSIALQSYFQKIALGPEEITPNISLGQTVNHIAAVIVPVVGGVVWEAIGTQYTFLAGVAIALLSLTLTLRMSTPQPGLIKAPSPIR